jgi:Tat protein secretion system quality control protein TatD with DNase activity
MDCFPFKGLNLSREISTHFAQEYLLKASCALAEKLELPVVLHISNAASLLRAIEILHIEGFIQSMADQVVEGAERNKTRFLLHDAMTCCEANVDHFKAAAEIGMYFLLAATGLTDSSEEQAGLRLRAQTCVSQLPLEQILLCTDSPWKTPQNMPDPYLCTLRNEPSNIPSIAVAISEARKADLKELSQQIRANTIEVLGLESSGADVAEVIQDIKVMKIRFADTEKVDISATQSPPQLVKKSSKATSQVVPSNACYSCLRCRARLFSGADIKAHKTNNATKTVFKVGEEGLCASTLLFKHSDRDAVSGTSAGNNSVTIRGNSVECAECSNKLGKLYLSETNCGCGAVVNGESPIERWISHFAF